MGSINIIDATVIEAKQSRKRKGKDGNNTQDPEAAYNVKIAADGKKKITYGFKMHANTDEDGFVKKRIVTPGNTHDSKAFDKLLDIKRTKDNKQRSSIRYIVERTFGLLKLHHGLGKARHLGIERNKTRTQLIAMSHHLKTGMTIFKQMNHLRDCCVTHVFSLF